jgi:hypothetical protein
MYGETNPYAATEGVLRRGSCKVYRCKIGPYKISKKSTGSLVILDRYEISMILHSLGVDSVPFVK